MPKTKLRTGSITVYYTPNNESFDDIVTALQGFGIAIGDVLPGKSEAAANITTAMTSLNQRVNQATKGSVDLRFLFPLALAVFALQQLHSKGSDSRWRISHPGIKSLRSQKVR